MNIEYIYTYRVFNEILKNGVFNSMSKTWWKTHKYYKIDAFNSGNYIIFLDICLEPL